MIAESEILFKTSPVFAPALTTNKRYIDIMGGRGRGGSYFGTDFFLFKITQPQYFRGYFIRQAFNDIRDSLFRDFKDRIADNPTVNIDDFKINESEMRIEYKPTGNIITSKGVKKDGQRTAKMKSLAGATHILVEEADELGEEDFDQMDDSLRTMKVETVHILRIFNPPHKQHWIWRDYILREAPRPADYPEKKFPYYKMEAKPESNVLCLFSTFRSNLNNVNESTVNKFLSYKINKPEYYYTIICGLISEGMKGRIFSGWQTTTTEEFNTIEARSIFGLDFGVVTGGLVEAKIVKNNLYLRELNYEGGTARQLAIKMARLGVVDQIICADSAEPLKIAKLRRGWTADELTQAENGINESCMTAEDLKKYPVLTRGFNIHGVVKPPGSVKFGIDLIKDYNIFVTTDSKNLWNEYREYKWALDKNKNPLDEPIDDHNHLIDPSRYVAMSKGRLF